MLKLASFSLVLAFSISSFAVSNDVRFFDLKSTTEDHPEKGTAVQVNISSQLMTDPATDHKTPNEIWWWHMDPAHPYGQPYCTITSRSPIKEGQFNLTVRGFASDETAVQVYFLDNDPIKSIKCGSIKGTPSLSQVETFFKHSVKFGGPFKISAYDNSSEVVTSLILKQSFPLLYGSSREYSGKTYTMSYQNFADGVVSSNRHKLDQEGCFIYGNFNDAAKVSALGPISKGGHKVSTGMFSDRGVEFKNQMVYVPIADSDMWAELNCTTYNMAASFKESLTKGAGNIFEVK